MTKNQEDNLLDDAKHCEYPPKIIRRCCIITPREINEPYGKLHAVSKIAAVVEEANELAAQLEYPKDCDKYEIFDLDYWADERPMNQTIIASLEEMLSRASAAGIPAKYTYVVDGEHDKDGNKL